MHDLVNIERSLNKLKEDFLTKMKIKLDLEIRTLKKEENHTANGIQAWIKETFNVHFLSVAGA